MKFGSLFSGIGGIDLGLERAGMECIWQVESNKFCRQILSKHWPKVRRFKDVREVGVHNLERANVIAGGFPCQPVSHAGHRLADEDERWLWPEYFRIVGELRPDLALVENVGALTVRGLQRVLGDFCSLGFDAEWATLPAAAFGAVHKRDRVFIVAYPAGNRLEGRHAAESVSEEPASTLDNLHDWPVISEPFGLRVVNGIPDFVDRINALGNAVVPHAAEWIGRRIMLTDGEYPQWK